MTGRLRDRKGEMSAMTDDPAVGNSFKRSSTRTSLQKKFAGLS